MKKVLVGAAAAVMVLSIGAAGAFWDGAGHGCQWADDDGDGVCDLCGSGHFCREDGAAWGCHQSVWYVDENGGRRVRLLRGLRRASLWAWARSRTPWRQMEQVTDRENDAERGGGQQSC